MNKLYMVGLLLLSTLTSNQVQAAPSFKAGLNIWKQNIFGQVKYEGGRSDVRDDFDMVESYNSMKIYFETQGLLLFFPDFRFYYDKFEHNGETSEVYKFGNINLAEGAKASIKYEALGLVAFYPHHFFDLLDTRIGVDIRKASLGIKLSSFETKTKAEKEVSYVGTKEMAPFIPMVYGQALINIPTTDIYSYVEAQYTMINSHRLLDYRLAAGFKTFYGVNLEAGYRNLGYRTRQRTKDKDIKLKMNGPFVELNYVF